MIFPEVKKIKLKIYFCPKCKIYYENRGSDLVCAVQHAPGSCCHYGDKVLPHIIFNKIMEVINGGIINVLATK